MIVEFSMFPTDKGESAGKYVARALDLVDKSGLPYKLTAMGTMVEGDWDQLFALIKKCHESLQGDCNRIYSIIKLDYRRGVKDALTAKVESVERALGRDLKK